MAHAGVLASEAGTTATAVPKKINAHLRSCRVTVERVLTDNDSVYVFRSKCAARANIQVRDLSTRLYRP